MSSETRHAPLALWRIAQAFINTLYNLFGAPEDLAARHTLLKKERDLVLDWLRAGEALMRRLLLIEAVAYASAAPPPSSSRRAKPRQRKLMTFSAEHPETWRVSFRCINSSPACGGSVSAQSAVTMGAAPPAPSGRCATTSPVNGGGVRFFSAWPLAERCEALLRVFNDPAPYAKRLARRLARTPKAARAFTTFPLNAPNLIGQIDFAATDHPTEAARRHFDSS